MGRPALPRNRKARPLPLAIPFPDWISPNVFPPFELGPVTVALRWYALAYIAGILVAWRIMVSLLRREALWPGGRAPMRPEEVEPFVTWIVVGVVAGGRLGYVLFYAPEILLADPLQVLRVWDGGMSFHGGLIGVALAAFLYARRVGMPLLSMADLGAVAATPGLLLGRLANFVNAELWGRPTDAPWGVIFPGLAAQSCGQPEGVPCARHPSQLYEAALEGLLLFAVLWWMARSGLLRRPGLIAGVFFLGYGLARFLVELVRQPDAQFAAPGNPLGWALDLGGWGLTMGQILSLPMIAAGLALIAVSRRHPAPAA
ncbi:prolipoprotein diacylglyceryl transferase [Hasllibacter halocynthiae]|uniref:Phosphatidylglycerol--prolipoprotein diacylglyceryl transferase n=1 Tax=Hasllibacter halocynthiae TaxID=595589 RepID=A0A2T0X0W9_9RHOB|nr:prolipoprotein diacylglyceryl transferase [Hasllibacter halocynthiae]PRY92581.1 prolipoprotein diacylglyceryl transferase [Hasllibacter halocynthiae]